MLRRSFLICVTFLLFVSKGYATHIVGGEIYYDYLGGDNYRITLKVYRDCYTGLAPYDNPASVFIFNSAGTFIDSLEIPFPGSVILPATISSPCFSAPTDVCVEEAIYEAVINLPPIPGGYDITYQRCCRNNTILNLVSPGSVGSTYTAHIPDASIAASNSSPRFNNFPPIFICSGIPLVFDHSATDPDGDSLYYEFCDPYEGLDASCPSLGASAAASGCPAIGNPPPYAFVPWLSPYSGTYPMSSSPAMNVDQVTGLMTGTPNMLGQWVVGVCVSEYRAGVLIDVNKRDFQFNVMDCPGLPVASIPMQTLFCFGYNVNFTQNSLNASTYHWDFGDPTTLLDTSDIFAPTWTYPDSGIYNVTLIINPGTSCADTTVNTFYIYPLLDPSFVPPPPQCFSGNSYNFTGGGSYLGNGTFSWNFGGSSTPLSSALEDPVNICFTASGIFPVTYTVSENGCTESYTDSVEVLSQPLASFGSEYAINCTMSPVQFLDSSVCSTAMTYEWDFDNGSTSTLQNPVTNYATPGTYDVILIVTSADGCKDTAVLATPLSVLPPPVADFSIQPHCFTYHTDFIQLSAGVATFLWDFGDPTTAADSSGLASPFWIYPDSGSYTITLVINPGSGCTDTATHSFFMHKLLSPDLATPPGQCDYLNSFNFSPGGSYEGNGSFAWSFGANAAPASASTENVSNVVFDTAGVYPVSITISENGCTATDSILVTVYPKPVAGFECTTTYGCVLNPVHFIDVSASDTTLTYQWDFGNGTFSTAEDPWALYTSPGNYPVTEIVTTVFGCKDTFYFPAPLIVYPSPTAGFTVSPTYTSIFLPDVAMTDQSFDQTACTFSWGDGGMMFSCGDSVHTYTSPGSYTLMQIVVNQFGCYDTAYQHVIVDNDFIFWIPNAFTPNSNGLNDGFKPVVHGVHDYNFMIFDRWGEKIFETTDTEVAWKGIYKEKICSQDVYVYKVTFVDDVVGDFHQYIGGVTLVR
jgi:gliding motility-associated-like protein